MTSPNRRARRAVVALSIVLPASLRHGIAGWARVAERAPRALAPSATRGAHTRPRGGLRRRTGLAMTAVMLGASFMVVPGTAHAEAAAATTAPGLTSPTTPPRLAPAGPAPDTRPTPPPAPTAAPGPVEPPTAPLPTGYVEGVSEELPDRRTETSAEFVNPDGTHITRVGAVPMHFQKDGAWVPIDNRVVADGPGRYRNAANSWTARFSSLPEGVVVESDRGALRWQPQSSSAVAPVFDPANDRVVTYPDAWPNVDLRYTLQPNGVKEELVIKGRSAPSSFVFGTGGARPTADGAGLRFRGLAPGGGDWVVPPAEVFPGSGAGAPAAAAAPSLAVEDTPGGPAVRVGLNALWLAAQPDSAFPIVLDPTLATGGGATCYKNDAGRTTVTGCQVRIGNPNDGFGMWRSYVGFNISSVTGSARHVLGAQIVLDLRSQGTANSYGASINKYKPAGDCWYNCPDGYLQGQPVGDWAVWGDAGQLTQYLDSVVQAGGTHAEAFFAGTEVANLYSYKRFDYFLLELAWNTKPAVAVPAAPSPGNGASVHMLTPTLNASSSDADGDALSYWYRLTTDTGALVWDSGWQAPGARTVPSGLLWWGQTYRWSAYVNDGWIQTDPNYTHTFTVANAPPNPPASSTPVDGTVLTMGEPTLVTAPTTDPDGDTGLEYQFRVVSGDDINAGLAIDSGWQTGLSWTVPLGSLKDGATFTWGVRARDALGASNSVSNFGATRKFRYDLRLGVRPTLPYDSFGPVSVNLATGNVTTALSGPALTTVGDPVSVTLAYDSQRPVATGLEADYYQDWDGDGVLDANEKPLVHRIDQQLSFQWGTAGPAPGQLQSDKYIGVWTGRLLPPNGQAGSYRVVVDSLAPGASGKATVKVGSTDVLTNADADFAHPSAAFNLPATGSAFRLEFAHGEGASNLTLRIYADGGAASTAQTVSAGMLRPQVPVLPDGWASTGAAPIVASYSRLQALDAARIELVDDDGATHVYTASGGGWLPPADEQAVLTREGDGSWSLFAEDGYLYRFDTAGRLTEINDINDDIHPGGLTYSWGSPNGDGVQRLTSIRDAANRTVTLWYGNDSASNPSCPSISGTSFTAAPANQLCRIDYAAFGLGRTELYYSNGHLARAVNPGDGANGAGSLGPTWDMTYTADGLLETVREPVTNDLMFAPAGGSPIIPVSERESLRHRTVVTYTAGRATRVLLPVDNATRAEADRLRHDYVWYQATGDSGAIEKADVRVNGLAMPNGYARRVELSPAGHPLRDLGPDGTGVDNEWDGLKDRLTSTTDHHNQAGSAGFKKAYEYDAADRLTVTRGPHDAGSFASAPVSRTRYDEGITGLAAAWYPNAELRGAPTLHTTTPATQSWAAAGPARTNFSFPADNFSGRLTGEVTLPQASKLRVDADGARLYVDDKLQLDTWGGPYRKEVKADAPMHAWRLGEAAGATTAGDSNGFAPGTYNGSVTRASTGALLADGDTAATFPGVAGSNVTAAVAASDTLPRWNVTLEAWVNLPDLTRSGAFLTVGTAGLGYAFGVGSTTFNNGSAGNNLIGLIDGRFINSGSAIGTGWHHVAMTIGPPNGNGDVVTSFFIDGQPKGTNTGTVPSDPGTGIALGGYAVGGTGRWFAGGLDEVAVYPSVLGQARLLAHRDAGKLQTSSTKESTDVITAGTHRVRLEYQELTGNASFALAGVSTTIATAPRYNLITSTVDPDGNVTANEFSNASMGPEFGLPTATVTYPDALPGGGSNTAGKQLRSTMTYEAPGAAGGFLRRTGATLPKGPATETTSSYFGVTETANNPCPGGATGINQAGAAKETADADPDAGGAQQRLKRQFRYDLAGRLVASRAAVAGKISTKPWECARYDARGRITQAVDRDGRTTTHTYTTADRVTVTFTDSGGTSRTIVAVGDWLGRLLTYSDEHGTTIRSEYDLAGRLVKKHRRFAGQAETLLWETTFDTAGRTDLVKDYSQSPVAITDTDWDATGLVQTVKRPNGIQTTTTLDASRGRVSRVSHGRQGQTPLSLWDYAYSTGGRINRETASQPNRARDFSYDAAGRLTTTVQSGTSPATRQYAYDDNSNRCARATTCATPQYAYDNADRILSSPDASSYAYDDYGNTTAATLSNQRPPQELSQSFAVDANAPSAAQSFPLSVGQAGPVTASVATSGTGAPIIGSGSGNGMLAPGQSGTTTTPVNGQSRIAGTLSWPADSRTATEDTEHFVNAAVHADDYPGVNVATKTVPATGAGTISATVVASQGENTERLYSSTHGDVPALGQKELTFRPNANGYFVSHVYANDQFGTSTLSQQLLDESGNVLKTAPAGTTLLYEYNDLPTYGASHTFKLRLISASPTSTPWYLDTTYSMHATLTTELLNPAGARVALATKDPTAPRQTLTYNNPTAGNYTLRITSADAWAELDATTSYPVAGHADVTLQLKDPQGNVVAQNRTSNGSAAVAYNSSASAGGTYTWTAVNNGPTFNANWSLNWTATTLADDTSTGSVAAGGSASRSVTADAAGYAAVDLTWTKGNRAVTNASALTVPAGSTGSKTITHEAAGTISASYSWNSDITSYSGSGSVGVAGTTFGPEFTTSANGPVSITLGWDPQTPNPDLDLTIINKATGAVVWPTSPNPAAGNSETATFTESGLSYGGSRTYQVKVSAKTIGSSFTLSGTYRVWDKLAKFELLNSSNTVVSSVTPPASGSATVSLSAAALPAGTYTIRATSGGSRSGGILTETHQVLAFADLTVALKNSGGTVIASDRKATGAAGFTATLPAAGTYTIAITNHSSDLTAPSYSLVVTRPKQHAPSVTLALKNASGTTVAAASGPTPSLTHEATRGAYALEVTPFTGVGTATLTATYPSATAEMLTYDGQNRATSIDDGLTKVVETLSPSGRVLQRRVLDSVTGAVKEDVLYGYEDGGNSPSYTKPNAGGAVTTYVMGPSGLLAIVTGAASVYPLITGHGDIAGTADAAGAFTAAPPTDEFGVGPPAVNGLGWLGGHQRQVASASLGLIRMGVRIYDPSLGRFLQADPVKGGSCNDYDYVCADPVNRTDLDGRYIDGYARWDVNPNGNQHSVDPDNYSCVKAKNCKWNAPKAKPAVTTTTAQRTVYSLQSKLGGPGMMFTYGDRGGSAFATVKPEGELEGYREWTGKIRVCSTSGECSGFHSVGTRSTTATISGTFSYFELNYRSCSICFSDTFRHPS